MYLADLFSEKPKYKHKECGSFYSFGWCSEREIAFNTLLEIFGYRAKIKQSSIHTWSEILVKFKTANNKQIEIRFIVDNTFDIIRYETFNANTVNWLKDIGNGSTIKWYNAKAHSQTEVSDVKNITVSDQTIKRIKKSVTDWLREISK